VRTTLTATDGVRLAVDCHSTDGPTIVLVHGFPDTSRVWDEVVDAMTPWARVITYDVRGAGASGRPRSRDGYRFAQLAADLVTVLDHVQPDEPVHVVGHDWGAIQAFEAVCLPAHAARIASFTCVSGASFDHAGRALRQTFSGSPRLGRTLRQLRKSWYIGAFQLPVLPERAFHDGTGARILEALEHVEPRPGHPADTLAEDGANGVELYRANLHRVMRPQRSTVHVPTQVVIGTQDPFVSMGLFDELAELAPEAFLQRIHGGHWLPRTHPTAIAEAVQDLVRHVEDGVTSPRLERRRLRPGAPVRQPLGGRVAVVTGAANGIGRATALALAGEGAHVALVDLDGEGLTRAAAEVAALGVDASTHVVDVADGDAMAVLVKDVVAELGVPTVVVNNAGIGMTGPFLDTTAADWDRILGVNLWGVIHGSRLFAAEMVAAGLPGHVVNLSSGLAYAPARDMSAYVATTAAVLRLSEVLRTELGDHGIGVSAICPGVVDTGITDRTAFVGVDDEEADRKRITASALYRRRAYSPDRVATAIVDAIHHDRAIVPVSPEAHVGWALSRLSPALTRRLSAVHALGLSTSRTKDAR
jgi:short-subunit dehydrogenase/pimeloyl-ACP methyl ester carboxylesterase